LCTTSGVTEGRGDHRLQHLEPNGWSRHARILRGERLTKIPEVAELSPNLDSCTNAYAGYYHVEVDMLDGRCTKISRLPLEQV
jgi:hypothetical protein